MPSSSQSSHAPVPSAADSGATVSAGMVVVRASKPVGRVTFVDPSTGMLCVEALPAKPRAKNWYTAKEWRESGLTVVDNA